MSEKVCANCACYYKERCRVRRDYEGNWKLMDPKDTCDGFTDSKSGNITTLWCNSCNRYTKHQYLYTYSDDDEVIQVDKCLVCGHRKHW